MEMWQPAPGAEATLEWFDALVALARRLRAQSFNMPVYIDDFEFCGRTSSKARGHICLYKHVRSGREIFVDSKGRTYRYVAHRSGKSAGRFVETRPDDTMWKVLHDVTPMKLYHRAPPAAEHHPAAGVSTAEPVQHTGTEGRAVRHLHLIDCT